MPERLCRGNRSKCLCAASLCCGVLSLQRCTSSKSETQTHSRQGCEELFCGKKLLITDFALVRLTSVPLKTFTAEVVTLWYRAEVLMGGEYVSGVDGMRGMCICGDVTGFTYFVGISEVDQLFQIFSKLGSPSENLGHKLRVDRITPLHFRTGLHESTKRSSQTFRLKHSIF